MRSLFREIEEWPFQRSENSFFNQKLRTCMRTNLKIMLLFWIPIYATVAMKISSAYMGTRSNKIVYHQICSFPNATILESDFDCSYAKKVMPWLSWFPFATDKDPGNFVRLPCEGVFGWRFISINFIYRLEYFTNSFFYRSLPRIFSTLICSSPPG